MIPQTFDEWHKCIVNDCRINLTREFAEKRLSIYRDKETPESKKFISLYGENHLNNIIQWYSQIR